MKQQILPLFSIWVMVDILVNMARITDILLLTTGLKNACNFKLERLST